MFLVSENYFVEEFWKSMLLSVIFPWKEIILYFY